MDEHAESPPSPGDGGRHGRRSSEPRPEKVAVVDEVARRVEGSSATLLCEFRGLDVAAMSTLRRSLRDAGGELKIYKNTLVRRAVTRLGRDDLTELLVGPNALAFVEGDVAAVAKALRDFSREHPGLQIKGGLLGDRLVGATDVTALADLPSREQLLAQIAGLFAAPLTQMASLLAALPRDLAWALQALIDKGGAGGAAGTSPGGGASAAPAAEGDGTDTTGGADTTDGTGTTDG